MRLLIVTLRLAAAAEASAPEPIAPPLPAHSAARAMAVVSPPLWLDSRGTQDRAAVQAQSSPLDRPVTLVAERVALKAVLDEVARQVATRIAYSRRVVPLDKIVTARFERVRAGDVLRELLRGTGVVPILDADGQILLVSKGSREASGECTSTISGIIRETRTNVPVRRAAVRVDNGRREVVTRDDGHFVIKDLHEGTHRLQARRLGYMRQDTTIVVGENEQAVVDFLLAPTAQRLTEVVAIGYGTTSRRDLTGAVSTVTGEQLVTQAAPTISIGAALQGKAPGVQVVSGGGLPGGGVRVRIRGTGSITASSEPLYVIDGMPAAQGSNSSDVQVNPLMSIDPGEIDEIDILRDASATAIYGARGANGVILITTRRGRQHETQLRMESSYGLQRISKTIPVLNGPQYMALANEARVNAGLSPLYADAEIAAAPTYDYPEMLLRTAPQVSEVLGMSGGDERLRFNLGANYVRQDGIAIGSDVERYGLRLNVDVDLTRRFRVQTSLNMVHVGRNAASVENGSLGNAANGILAAMEFAPFQPPRDSAGKWVKTSPSTEPVPNPIANSTELTDFTSIARVLGNFAVQYDLTPSLALRSTLGGNFGFEDNHYYAPRTILAGGAGGTGRLYTNLGRELANDNAISYSGTVGGNRLDAVGAFTVQRFYNEFVLGQGQGFPTDATNVFNLGSAATLTPAGSGTSQSAILSYLGRVGYNVDDRFLFTVSNRYDGSSRFGIKHKWVWSPAVALAWRLTEERFMKRQSLISDLKFRVGYGKVGNQAVEPYQSLSALRVQWYSFGGTEIPAIAPAATQPNPDLKWEQKTELNVGMDAGFWQNRVLVSLDGYRARTNDLLLSVSLPTTTGFTSQLRNIGAVRNHGVELSVATANIQRPGLTWLTRFQLAANRNRVLELRTPSDTFFVGARGAFYLSPAQTHLVTAGLPLGTMYGYQVNGLWQQNDQCHLTVARDCTPGEYKIADTNGDGAITSSDRVILGYADPKYFGGMSNTITVGRLTLDATATFAQGNQVINAGNAYGALAIGQTNERATVLGRWTPTNTNTSVPRANNARPRRLYSTLVEDGSYVRLQTVTLGYQLPERAAGRAQAVRLFLTGQNLWLHTRYTGFDPDVNSSGGDARAGSIDTGAYPRAKVWNVGASVVY
ncbi:MAG: SusC/RagA family TonB-linked outer membrane protein [Gemmatimonadaceae bacterium]